MTILLLAVIVLTQILNPMIEALDTQITVDCHHDPENMVVNIDTDVPFSGTVYVSAMHRDPECITHGTGNRTTKLRIPYKGCNTTKKDPGLFMNRITIQQHQLIVSAGDGEYEVGCKMFAGDIKIGSASDFEVTQSPKNVSVSTENITPPKVLLRIYDFENDIFVDTVRLGQVVELEITISDGNFYKGRVSDCDAFGDNIMFPVIRN